MDIKLYNTLSRKIETFRPLQPGMVSMYHCGPTVYDRAHIGNLRSYVFADSLRRTFEYNGYSVKQVINVTDVGHLSGDNQGDADSGEDKMTKALRRENKPMNLESMKEVGTKYFKAFKEDLISLNIELPSDFPRASECIQDDIELIKELDAKVFVYKTSDGVYFDTSKFDGYGKLGGIVKDPSKNESRMISNPEKRSPADFAVWKFNNSLGWDSPWGKGFPGWHIECSAMSRKYLGQPFDIHTGGIDHIPVHHNNEIAQSEAAYGEPLADYWMHNAFITVNEDKMAKSAENFITIDSLKEETVSPLAYRYWLLTAHYRSPVNFSYEAVRSAQNALVRLIEAIGGYPDGGKVIKAYKEPFLGCVNDDLDMPKAVALVWELLKDPALSPADKRATMLDFDRVLGLKLADAPRNAGEEDIPAEVRALAEAREDARKAKDWDKADALRKEIESRGYEIKDTDKGYEILGI